MSGYAYFAYGSNMDADLLLKRLSKTDRATLQRRRGLLADHSLLFDKLSSIDPAIGYASIRPQLGGVVEGVINDVDERDLLRLDEIELVPVHYRRTTATVFDTALGQAIETFVYVGNEAWTRSGLIPEAAYVARLLRGQDILSPEYVAALSRIPSRADPKEPEQLHP